MEGHTRSTKATCHNLIVKQTKAGTPQSPCAPVTFAVLIVHASEVLLARRFVDAQLQWLVDVSREIVGVVGAYLHERIDVLLDLRWRETPHEIEHRRHDIHDDFCESNRN